MFLQLIWILHVFTFEYYMHLHLNTTLSQSYNATVFYFDNISFLEHVLK